MDEEPPPKWVLDFLREYYTIWDDLVELLDIDLSGGREPNPLEVRLAQRHGKTLEMAKAVDRRAGFRLPTLGILVNNLRILQQKAPAIYSEYKDDFHRFERDNYFGWRCEVDTAAFLARNDIEFTHPDPPDFRIQGYSEPFSIECTTARYTSSSVDIDEKVRDAVSSKSGKEYYNPSTLLVVDITNVHHTNISRGQYVKTDELKDAVRERFDTLNLEIGSVLLLGYIGEIEEAKVVHATDRIDNNPSEGVFEFLEEHFPFGEGSAELRYFPSEP